VSRLRTQIEEDPSLKVRLRGGTHGVREEAHLTVDRSRRHIVSHSLKQKSKDADRVSLVQSVALELQDFIKDFMGGLEGAEQRGRVALG
jgi:hypothetical protein